MFIACAAILAICTFIAPAQAALTEVRYIGSYTGSYLGDADFGSCELTINADGNIYGTGSSNKYEIAQEYSGSCQNDGTFQFTTANGSLKFAGRIDWMNRMFGRWTFNDNSESGSFTAVPTSWAN